MDVPEFVPDLAASLDEHLRAADEQLAADYPGEPTGRGPVHTVYVPGDLFTGDTVAQWGGQALDLLDRFAPDAATLAAAVGVDVAEVEPIYQRLRAKLTAQPIEDLRVDFEDGYGRRDDAIEDEHLAAAVDGLRAILDADNRPTWWGIRFKCLEAPTRAAGCARSRCSSARWPTAPTTASSSRCRRSPRSSRSRRCGSPARRSRKLVDSTVAQSHSRSRSRPRRRSWPRREWLRWRR